MRNTALALVVLFFAGLATAQSLAELAKTEKDRRKANANSGRKAVRDVGAVELEEAPTPSPAEAIPVIEPSSTPAEEDIEDFEERVKEKQLEYYAEQARCSEDQEGFNGPATIVPSSCKKAKRLLLELKELVRQRPKRRRAAR